MVNSPFDIEGRHIVLTGASRGIGAYIADLLVDGGAKVTGLSRGLPDVTAQTDLLTHYAVDISDMAAVEAVLSEAIGASGSIDCLINNAGIVGDAAEDDLKDVFGVNTIAPMRLAAFVCDHMIAHKTQGSVINIATALSRPKFTVSEGYAVSKAALEAATRQMAFRYARHGIRVNAIAPGWFRTPMTEDYFERGAEPIIRGQIPMRRLGKMEDLDGLVKLLVSDSSLYICGSIIYIDGGFHL